MALAAAPTMVNRSAARCSGASSSSSSSKLLGLGTPRLPSAAQLAFTSARSGCIGPKRRSIVASLHGCGSAQQQQPQQQEQQQEQFRPQQAAVVADPVAPPPRFKWLPSRLAMLAGILVLISCLAVSGSALAATAAQDGGFGGAVKGLVSFVLHLDKHLAAMITEKGPRTTYAILFGIVFAETGLVLTPFLPGDSLLFAAGAFCALGLLRLPVLMAVFVVAAVLGDAVNYAVGNYLGAKALSSRLINRDYIDKTEAFFSKYGGKTVVLARFVPIVRTFAPFVAGVGSMRYQDFAMFNVGGALLWTVLFCGAGYLFGNLPVVQHNFTLVVLAIILVSIVPVVLEVLAARREAAAAQNGDASGRS